MPTLLEKHGVRILQNSKIGVDADFASEAVLAGANSWAVTCEVGDLSSDDCSIRT